MSDCLVCGAPVSLIRMRNRRGVAASVSFKDGWAVSLTSKGSAIRLCDTHFEVLLREKLAIAWLSSMGINQVGLSVFGFKRIAKTHGLTPRLLKKRLQVACQKAALAKRRKKDAHDWAFTEAQYAWIKKHPTWALFGGYAAMHGILGGWLSQKVA